MSNYEYNPGSDEALDEGCKCPILDNAHGGGYYGNSDKYIINQQCPLHGADSNEE